MTRDIGIVVEVTAADAARLASGLGVVFGAEADRIREAIGRQSLFNRLYLDPGTLSDSSPRMVHVVDLFLVIRELLDGRLAADARNLLDEVLPGATWRAVVRAAAHGADAAAARARPEEVRGALWCCRLSGRSR